MIIGERILNKLKDFGLNSYEAKIWVALLSRGVSSAGELSDISNVPRSRAYDVLESLEKKGFIIMKIGKPIKYIAVKPLEVVERVKKAIQEQANVQAELLDEVKTDDVFTQLESLYTNGVEIIEPSELAASLRDRVNVYNNLNKMINDAQETIELMTTEEGLIRKSEAMRKTLEKAKKRGVKIRIAAPITKKSAPAAEKLRQFGEVKDISSVRARFCIVDGKEITFSLMDDEKSVPAYDVGIWVSTGFFAKAMQSMFNQMWEGKKTSILAKN